MAEAPTFPGKDGATVLENLSGFRRSCNQTRLDIKNIRNPTISAQNRNAIRVQSS